MASVQYPQRDPAGAPDARDPAGGRTGRTALAVLLGPVSPRTWWNVIGLVVSLLLAAMAFTAVTVALLAAATVSWVVGLGTLTMAWALRLAGWLAALDQRRLRQFTGTALELPPAPDLPPGVAGRHRRRALVQWPAARRPLWYELAHLPATAVAAFLAAIWLTNSIEFTGLLVGGGLGPVGRVFVVLLGVAGLLVWPLVVRLAVAADLFVARSLFGPGQKDQLSSEVRRLAETRALAVQSAEGERRRIERDLHDGFQPKLVSLALELGLAKAHFDSDPASARSLLDQAHQEAKTAVEDLRNLVRGIHPSVLDERGLDAALSGLVANCAVPVQVDLHLDHRPDRVPETVAYFVVAEAVTNVTKHAAATRAWVDISWAGDDLRVVVRDDGRGGATAAPGGGLTGLAARVAAVDGHFSVLSPPGGPTTIEAVIPCGR